MVHTRNGGGNREGYWPIGIEDHPNYIGDQDDDFDPTYADIYFSLPDAHRDHLIALARPEQRNTDAEWQEAVDRIGKGQL